MDVRRAGKAKRVFAPAWKLELETKYFWNKLKSVS